ncbi:response regulator [Chitinophaga sp. Cy-1792]|uniref:glycoside hydrolase family 130 protein n=1 Tax=Chitinophaga sp. Cy-1792 TaxID=2608339 RepID=UPI001420BC4D|nr:response regulator [Chitinophaga sp. Cy-1792]NIG55610.1 response regulator [Chitinophaga sp. Cy-1792]
MSIKVNRKAVLFVSDPKRVITRFFYPSPESRIISILEKVKAMPEPAAALVLNQTLRDFAGRHRNISKIYKKHFERACQLLNGRIIDMLALSENKQLLIGAYFTSEYSIESAAFFNPSIMEDPDQSGLRLGQKRVIISFRATGEGHVSSIVFRGGILDEENNLEIRHATRLVEEAEVIKHYVYEKNELVTQLQEKNFNPNIIEHVVRKLNNEFDYYELNTAITESLTGEGLEAEDKKMLEEARAFGDAYYEIHFSLDTSISNRVIFPITAEESNGIEDARFVRFTGDDGLVNYYATYTAYDGRAISPRLIQTRDFYRFSIIPIHGKNVQNKGMALFPRKVNGRYAMLARVDGVNNYIMYSDHLNVFGDAHMLQQPVYPWEFIQIGNCGSPIETPQGWLVVTHGVGTMRRYCLGAVLLDINDPTIVIGALSEPLIIPNENEREGYVPNVVYSCGAIVNGNELVIPYAMSDTASTYATISLDELLRQLQPTNDLVAKTATPSKGKILLVEDEALQQHLITRILKDDGYEVEIASDGIVALMKIAQSSFDLIVSDISMPNFDGYQLLGYLSTNKFKIPVILLTGFESHLEEEKGLGLGATCFLKKPVSKSILLDAVKTALGK